MEINEHEKKAIEAIEGAGKPGADPNPAYVLAGIARMMFPGVAIDWDGVAKLAKVCDELVEKKGSPFR